MRGRGVLSHVSVCVCACVCVCVIMSVFDGSTCACFEQLNNTVCRSSNLLETDLRVFPLMSASHCEFHLWSWEKDCRSDVPYQ